MTTIYHDDDADLGALEGSSVALVGYGNQGRSWALNLRDSGFDVRVCVRADASRDQAATDGFTPVDPKEASDADVVCILIPDDVIPTLELTRPADALTIVASGYTLAFDRLDPDGDVGMVAPRMLGPEVRACYEEGVGFITAVGVHRDATGRALARTLAVAIALYSYWALAGMAIYGRDPWTRHGEGFAVAFGLLARMAPFAAREGRIVVRWPLTGLGGAEKVPGTLVFVAVMLGSTSFDGFGRTSVWQDLIADVRARLVDESLRVSDLAITAVNLVGLAAFVAAVTLTYLAAVAVARRLVRAPRSLVPDFVLSLVPIALAYLVAHYFSLFVIYGQYALALASDPFGRGWDLFGTAGNVPNISLLAPNTVWYVQVFSLVVGHVAGLAVAHDRAVALFERRGDALRSQYPMLALMVLYTVGGLWLLSRG